MAYLLGIDIGTSGTKTLLIDDTGKAIASSTAEYPLYTPKPGWAEQDPEDWWQATVKTCNDVLKKSGINPSDIKGIGLSGQMHGSVFLDSSNQVIRPAILWCDQRTGKQCEWITSHVGLDKLVDITCNPVLTGFQLPKIIWLRDNELENYNKTKKVLLPKDYIRFRLSGEFATEVSDASGTSMLDVKKRQWSDELLKMVDVPRDWLPEVFESTVVSSKVSKEAADVTGLSVGTPIVGGGGDQAAGAVGNGIVSRGIVSSTVGTSGVVFAFADTPAVDPKLRTHTFCHAVPGKWHVMGVVLSAGGTLRWYRDTFAKDEITEAKRLGKDPYELITTAAGDAPVGSEGLVCLPYLTGERTPYPDPDARGVFFGLSLRHTKTHFSRSILEGVAYALRDSIEIFKEIGVPLDQVRASGGGARSSLWRQILADVSGISHVTINVEEGPAFGVALLAGVGTGVWGSVEEACQSTIKVISNTPPIENNVKVYDKYYNIYNSLYPILKGSFKELAETIEIVNE